MGKKKKGKAALPSIEEAMNECEAKTQAPEQKCMVMTDEQCSQLVEAMLESRTIPQVQNKTYLMAMMTKWYGMPCVDVHVQEDYNEYGPPGRNENMVHLHLRFRKVL